MYNKKVASVLVIIFLLFFSQKVSSQCGGVMEPGFRFLTSSKGCAPFTVNLEIFYLSSVAGTVYFVNWGDGTAEESFVQINATGVIVSHVYPNTSVDCGYDLTIDVSNACNPRGSVVEINTQVIVWTRDVISINPQEFRVCQGFATNLTFTDNSQWNCFPRQTRENSVPRWIQWIYGTGPIGNQIANVQVNTFTPGGYPYFNPAPNTNPIYPVLAPGQLSLPISIPATTVPEIGDEFVVTLKNWNQCNAYDNNLLDGNAFNPVGGNLVNGDNAPQVTTGRIVIVPSPQPTFFTRLGDLSGPIQLVFCIGDNIFFDEQTPAIGGASFDYTWEFFDNPLGVGLPLSTSNSPNPTFSYPTGGQKLIRLTVRDVNAAGNCLNFTERVITISPSLVAKIGVTDTSNNVIVPDFCQEVSTPLTSFPVRFNDVSVGSVLPTTQWRWEFYNESNVLVRQEPAVGFSSAVIGPFDQTYFTKGVYRVRLRVRDNATSCETVDEVQVRIFEKPLPAFTAAPVCAGQLTSFVDNSTLNPLAGESIVLREWDFNYNGVVFNKDPAFDNNTSFTRSLGAAATYQVALRVTTDQSACTSLIVTNVRVDPLPLVSFTPSVASGCGPLTIVFTNNSVLGQPDIIDRFAWEIDARDGLGFRLAATQRPTDPGFTATFTNRFTNFTTANKLYDIRLRVVTVNNCEDTSTSQIITVFPGTISGFSEINYSPFNTNCSPQSVDFRVDNQTQSLTPVDYLWRVSDSNGLISQTSTGTTPTFSFLFSNLSSSFKDFQVNLTTTLASTCENDSTRTIRISPVPNSLFVIDTLQFDCQVMRLKATAIQKGLSSYRWVISENGIPVVNTSSSSDEIERAFNRPGASAPDLLTVFSLDTRNFANCVSLPSSTLVTVPKRDAINAGFTVTPAIQTLPNATVTISNTTNPGPWTYLWDFGDGTTSTNPSPGSHIYSTYGVYVISLTVDNKECVERFSETVTILAIPPVVDFSFNPPSGCVPLTVDFTNLTQYADASKYRWDFGDGETSTEVNPTHVYKRQGTYSVSLEATNSTGAAILEVKANIITAHPRPVASFDVKPKLISIPGGLLYTSNLSFDATIFLWDFGDGNTSEDFRPEHAYQQEGIYTVRLRASNQFGCLDSASLVSAVRTQKSGQVLVPNAFSPSSFGGSSVGGGGVPTGDGKNDTFLPVMRGVTEFEMLVFNRWGELLFETKDATRGWDGSYNGKLCQQDVYMYKVIARFENGETVVRVGDINLIR